MRTIVWSALASAGILCAHPAAAVLSADSVVEYRPGTGYQDGFTDPSAALGAPSKVTQDPTWGDSAVDPYNPPYLAGQVVSVGASGSLTVRFSTPIANNPGNPYGLDFILFGNSGFAVRDYNEANWKASGDLFGSDAASARISVSPDGATFYTLTPSLCPVIDGLYPTDGAGESQLPVNPALKGADFAGQDMAGIRALYAGSAGGAGFDLSWAQDDQGRSVNLAQASYVRVEVLSQKAEIDSIVAVPEPSVWALCLAGLGLGAAMCGRRSR